MGRQIRVEPLHESQFDDWARLVRASPMGTVYALPDYLAALCRAAGGGFVVLGAWQGDELIGGVALYECDSRYGRLVAPRLLLYFNGPVLRAYETRYPSEQTARQLKTLSALEQAITARGYARVTLACSPALTDVRHFQEAGWLAAPQYTYVVDLGDPAAQWERVEQNLRRLILRCERESLACVADGDLAAFLALHASTMARKGGSLYLSAAGFRQYFDALSGAGLCRLFSARMPDGRVVASQIVLLGPNGRCHVVAAAADEAFLRSGSSAFLRWKAFEALSAAGCKAADLTDASLNAVTHFKSQLGGELQVLLVLDAPRSLHYRLGSGARAAYRGARTALARAPRRFGLRGGDPR